MGSGVALVIVILDRLVLSPWLSHAKSVRGEIHQMQHALQAHQRLLVRRDDVLEELKRYRRFLQPPIADDLQMAAFLKEVQEMAAQTHIEVGEIKPLPVEADEAAKRYSLEVRFQCTLDQWIQFVFLIETSPSLFEVVRAGLSTQEGQPDQLEGYLRVRNATMQAGASKAQADIGGLHATAVQ